MNERIRQLAVEAGMVMYPTGLGISENTLWGDRNISKFAELIVKECAGFRNELGVALCTDPGALHRYFGIE